MQLQGAGSFLMFYGGVEVDIPQISFTPFFMLLHHIYDKYPDTVGAMFVQ